MHLQTGMRHPCNFFMFSPANLRQRGYPKGTQKKESEALSETDGLCSSKHGLRGIGFGWFPVSHEGLVSRFKVQGDSLLLCSSTNFVGYSHIPANLPTDNTSFPLPKQKQSLNVAHTPFGNRYFAMSTECIPARNLLGLVWPVGPQRLVKEQSVVARSKRNREGHVIENMASRWSQAHRGRTSGLAKCCAGSNYPALLQLSCKVMQKAAPWPAEALTTQGDLDLRPLHINITGNVLIAKVRCVRPWRSRYRFSLFENTPHAMISFSNVAGQHFTKVTHMRTYLVSGVTPPNLAYQEYYFSSSCDVELVRWCRGHFMWERLAQCFFGCTGPYTLGPCLRKCLRGMDKGGTHWDLSRFWSPPTSCSSLFAYQKYYCSILCIFLNICSWSGDVEVTSMARDLATGRFGFI